MAAEPKQPVDLDALSNHWRVALDLAYDGLKAIERGGASLHVPPGELAGQFGRLGRERDETARLIDAIAREEHVHLRHRLSLPRASRRMVNLPSEVLACVFDLDGVLVGSAHVHQEAWRQTFDEFLTRWAERTGEPQFPLAMFTPRDYREHIHGKPRVEGVLAFLASRGIRLVDTPEGFSVQGLADRKNELLQRLIAAEGVAAFDGSLRFLEAADEAGLACAVVTASANADSILTSAGLASLVSHRIDGNTMGAGNLKPRPAPDLILAACKELGLPPGSVAGFETDRLGIAAGRAAGLQLTIGVDRGGRAGILRAAGADRVIADLSELLDPVLELNGTTAPASRYAASEGAARVSQPSHSFDRARLVLVRHGESTWNDKGLFTGWVDVELSERGEREAARAGELFLASGLLPDVLHTSVLRPRDPHRRDRACGRRAARGSRSALLAAERAPLRRAPGQEQGGDEARVRRRAVHALAPVVRRPAAAASRGLRARAGARPRYAELPPDALPPRSA